MSDATPISLPTRGERRWLPLPSAPAALPRSIIPLRRLSASLAAPHPGLWGLALAIALLDAAWLARLGIALVPEGFALAAGLVVALLGLALLFGPVKSEPSLRAMALASAALIAITLPIAVLHYLTATWALPLADARLARAEAALGFDWTAHIGFLEAHPGLARWLALAYHTSGPQVGLTVIVLGAARRLGRLWAFVQMFGLLLLAVVAVAALVPAAGPYAHYGVTAFPKGSIETLGALWHLDALAQLRAGTLRSLALGDIRGLVTFPSFHVCLAALTAWALAPIPFLGPVVIALNAVILVATLGAGGHYLPDLLAGVALSVAVIGGRTVLRRRRFAGLALARPDAGPRPRA
ncbi:phosphatase PAP2 family protein [Methylobacterium sp. J-068]|uniref:phosphatase PAP2 family protein n=1 Tax=Methylobacterium sp. J-068 TaxID=2836649 RepID=UPI001FBB292E|nr:phosphatase PAP2 family protein [Methylobacterium sp. J-068]MCJ2036219.1 phosphatase PAP2 family protein [Methylobacterium sp. J-068]